MTISQQIKKETAVLKDQLSIPTVYFLALHPADYSLEPSSTLPHGSMKVKAVTKKPACLLCQSQDLTKEPSSPACSRYDFEEKLLERVLRNELAIETMLKEIRETNLNVKSTLGALDKSKDDMDSKLTNAIRSGMTQISDLTQNASMTISEIKKEAALLKQNASMTISEIKKEAALLKDQLSIPTVYFHAYTPADYSLDSGQDVVYTAVRVNEGQGYDQNTGRFTVSIPGLYAFTVHFCANPSQYAQLSIVRDGTAIQNSYFHATTGHQCVSMQAFYKLALSMKIWVEAYSTSSLFNSGYYNSFSGVLLHL
ncbi:uncharacterized protein LOC127835978 [Dreissena polymorpha]|uniref:uncharacterized protein LOC127835978 n=1 Tax=Dreissena polymorpha TaxID=45954 RepID=UPI002263BD4F|nr:uncharacterized protein LOC127835978 [Dreissena polymorpha]